MIGNVGILKDFYKGKKPQDQANGNGAMLEALKRKRKAC